MSPFTIQEYQQFHLNTNRLEECYTEKWFKMFVPKTYNGLQLSMEEGCRKLLKIAEIQGGLGWTVNLGAGANWFAGFFDDEVANKLFSPEKAVIAGSGTVNGSWEDVKKGFEITGQWSKCTGAAHATLFSITAKNSDEEPKTFVVPREQVMLSKEKWPIMGMRNSSSFGISLQKATVPIGYDFKMNEVKNHLDYGVFHIPFQSFARLCMSASFLGVVLCLMRHCLRENSKSKVTSIIKNELEPLIRSTANRLYQLAERTENRSKQNQLLEQDAMQIKTELGKAHLAIFDVVQSLFLAGGLSFIEEDQIIHWAYRDVLTAVQHFMVKP
ncbi:hypothetical protein CW751_09690 [Brumimicrobium salinarum]|uniref:Acyl-CoA dehydrogenase n=1 Tax=Brumimicrobium salinarum TaxID=2058658 RepID=A0A2I0R236_9FLAO|nr:hypothetical protein [Brumimicrobium salinarum]PKR80632.1 hypothetical protein CW751_09690 [Brumimicrobium salinarum]